MSGLLIGLLAVVAAVVLVAAINAGINVAVDRDDRREELRRHNTWHVGDEGVFWNTCSICNRHDWQKWHAGACMCPRCRRIRDMEEELLP